MLLRYRPEALPSTQACRKAWRNGTYIPDDLIANKLLKDAVKVLNNQLRPIKGFRAIKQKTRGGGYRFEGEIEFCVIINSDIEAEYHLTI